MSEHKPILLSDPALALPSWKLLHQSLRGCVIALGNAADKVVVHHQGNAGALNIDLRSPFGRFLDTHVTEHSHGVYSFPYLDPKYCQKLVKVFDGAGHNVNPGEEVEAQIPEIVLKYRCYPLHQALATLWACVGKNMAQLLLNLDCQDDPSSIQAARYQAGTGNQGTVWHHDEDSDCTLVVNLGTECTGGGTEIAGTISTCSSIVPNLPAGHALLFPGRTTLHRGVPVKSGARNLLVHWVKTT